MSRIGPSKIREYRDELARLDQELDPRDTLIRSCYIHGESQMITAWRAGITEEECLQRLQSLKDRGLLNMISSRDLPPRPEAVIAVNINEYIGDMYRSGMQYDEISNRLNRSTSSVITRVRSLEHAGLLKRRGRGKTKNVAIDQQIVDMLKKDASQSEIARQLGVSRQRISQRVLRMRKTGQLKS